MTRDECSVVEVVDHLLRGVAPVASEGVATVAAAGRVLAEPAIAVTDLPPEARAAMDGWAVRAADLPGTLPVDGEQLAGAATPAPLLPGRAVRIATGAAVPDGADTVVRMEDGSEQGARVVLPTVATGANIRQQGEECAAGAVLLAAGARLGPGALAGLAGAGVATVVVRRRPRVAVVRTGDEVARGVVPDALGVGLAAFLDRLGAEVALPAPVGDDVTDLAGAMAAAAAGSDLVVTTGGVSVGPRDLVAAAAATVGTVRSVHVRFRPGRPVAHGAVAGVPLLCLPGNPGAALALAEVLLRPVVAGLLATAPEAPRRCPAAEDLHGDALRTDLVPVLVTADGVVPLPGRGSGDLVRLAATEGWAHLPEGVATVAAGAEVDVLGLP